MDAEQDLWQETQRGVRIVKTVKQASANLTVYSLMWFVISPCGEGESLTENQSTAGLDMTDWV